MLAEGIHKTLKLIVGAYYATEKEEAAPNMAPEYEKVQTRFISIMLRVMGFVDSRSLSPGKITVAQTSYRNELEFSNALYGLKLQETAGTIT